MKKRLGTLLVLSALLLLVGCGNNENAKDTNVSKEVAKNDESINGESVNDEDLNETQGYKLPLSSLSQLYEWTDEEGAEKTKVYFGSFPQKECTWWNTEEELWQKILNADYNDDEIAEVDGNKYMRFQKEESSGYQYFLFEPLKWQVLARDEEKIVLLADRVIYCMVGITKDEKKYREPKEVEWEVSIVRSWLNGYAAAKNREKLDYTEHNFLNMAFSEEEKNVLVDLSKVKMLKERPNTKASLWFFDGYTDSNNVGFKDFYDNLITATNYACALGANNVETVFSSSGNSSWAVRTLRKDDEEIEISQVSYVGTPDWVGWNYEKRYFYIRPVISIATSDVIEQELCGIAYNSTETSRTTTAAYAVEVVTDEEKELIEYDTRNLNSILSEFSHIYLDYIDEEEENIEFPLIYSYDDLLEISKGSGIESEYAKRFLDKIQENGDVLEWKSAEAKDKTLYFMYDVTHTMEMGEDRREHNVHAKIGTIFG